MATPPSRTSATWPVLIVISIVAVSISTVLVVREVTPDRRTARNTTTGQETSAGQPPSAGNTDVGGPTRTDPAPPPGQDPADDARRQAVAVDALLDESVASRRKLNLAIDQVRRCAGVNGALTALRQVGDERRDQLGRTATLRLDGLTGGEQIRSHLRQALRHSLDADESFVAWASAVARAGCRSRAPLGGDYRQAQSHSEAAGRAKRLLIASWNPVAAEFGLPARSRDDI